MAASVQSSQSDVSDVGLGGGTRSWLPRMACQCQWPVARRRCSSDEDEDKRPLSDEQRRMAGLGLDGTHLFESAQVVAPREPDADAPSVA